MAEHKPTRIGGLGAQANDPKPSPLEIAAERRIRATKWLINRTDGSASWMMEHVIQGKRALRRERSRKLTELLEDT